MIALLFFSILFFFSMDENFSDAKESDFSHVPLRQLLRDTNWKTRRVGYERLRHLSQNNESQQDLYSCLADATCFVKESNVIVLDAALEALTEILRRLSGRNLISADVLHALVEKGSTGKPRSASLCKDCLCELFALGNETGIIEALMKAKESKNPKHRCFVLKVLNQILTEFGTSKSTKSGEFLRAVVKNMNDADGNVRKEAFSLIVQLYSYLGDNLRPLFLALREVQKEELEKEFARVIKPDLTKLRRIYDQENEIDNPESGVLEEKANPQLFRSIEPTAVLSKLPRNFFSLLSNKGSKWQDKITCVEKHLMPLIQTPALLKEDYTDLVKVLRTLVLDPNLPLQVLGIKCLGQICEGLGSTFSTYARLILPCLFAKFKEKKRGHLTALVNTLNIIVTRALSFDDLFEEWEVAATSKVPNQRVKAIEWASNLFTRGETTFSRLRASPDLLIRLQSDEKVEVREATKKLQNLMNIPTSSSSPDTITCETSPNTSWQATKDVMHKTQKKQRQDKQNSVLHSVERNEKDFASSLEAVCRRVEKELMTVDEIKQRLLTTPLLPFLDQLMVDEWSGRREALQKMKEFLFSQSREEVTHHAECILSLLAIASGWKEENIYCFGERLLIVRKLLDTFSAEEEISLKIPYLIVNGLFHRFTDSQFRTSIHEIFALLIQLRHSRFVLVQVIVLIAQNTTKPRLVLEGLVFIQRCVERNSPVITPHIQLVIQHSRRYIAHLNVQIRETVIKILASSIVLIGVPRLDQLDDVKPQTKKLIESEMKRMTGKNSTLDFHFPLAGQKIDSKSQTKTSFSMELLKDLSSSTEWSVYSGALKQLEQDLENDQAALTISRAGEIVRILSKRLEDTNKNLVSDTLRVILFVLRFMGPNLKPFGRTLSCAAFPLLSDLKRGLRKAAVEVCTLCTQFCGIETVLPTLIRAMTTESTYSRQHALEIAIFTLSSCTEAKMASPDPIVAKSLISPLLRLLMDRSTSVRDEAEVLLDLVAPKVGYEHVLKVCGELKPIEQQILHATLTRFRGMSRSGNPSEIIHEHAPPTPHFNESEFSQDASPTSSVYTHNETPFSKNKTPERFSNLQRGPTPKTHPLGAIQGFDSTVSNQEDRSRPSTKETLFFMIKNESSEQEMVGAGELEEKTLSTRTARPTQPIQSSEIGKKAKTTETEPSNTSGTRAKLSSLSSPGATKTSLPTPSPSNLTSEPRNLRESYHIISYESIERAVSQCQEWTKVLHEEKNPLSFMGREDVVALYRALLHRLQTVLDNFELHSKLVFQHLLETLQAMTKRASLLNQLEGTDLQTLFAKLLDRLVQSNRVADLSCVKVLNSLTLRLIENSETSTCMEALLYHLNVVTRSYFLAPTKINQKFMEVAVKCILRCNRQLRMSPISRAQGILKACDRFIKEHPPDSFEGKDNLALRTVKTILHDLAKVMGVELRKICEEISFEGSMTQCFVNLSLQKVLPTQTSTVATTRTPLFDFHSLHSSTHSASFPNLGSWGRGEGGGEMQPSTFVTPSSQKSSPTQQRHDLPITHDSKKQERGSISTMDTDMTPPVAKPNSVQHMECDHSPYITYLQQSPSLLPIHRSEDALVRIFSKIRMLNYTEQGLHELYQFIKANPRVDIRNQFYKCSEAFQNYIVRRIKKYYASELDAGIATPNFLEHIPVSRGREEQKEG